MNRLKMRSLTMGLVLMIGTSIMAMPVTVGDKTSEISAKSINGRTLIKSSDVENLLNLKINFEEMSQTITVGKELKMVVGEKELHKSNGEVIKLDTAAIILENRTYLPLRAIAEVLGYKVDYKEGAVYLEKQEKTIYTAQDIAYLTNLYEKLEEAQSKLEDNVVPLAESNKVILDNPEDPKYSEIYTTIANEFDTIYSKVMGVTSLRNGEYVDSDHRLSKTDLNIEAVLFNYLSCYVKYLDAMAAKNIEKAMDYAYKMGDGFDEVNKIMKEAIQKDLATIF